MVRKTLLHFIILIILLIPLFYETYLFVSGQLGNVIDDSLLHFSGDVAIAYFIFIFIFQLFFSSYARFYFYRAVSKDVGIAIFFYALIHILAWLILKQGLNIDNALGEIYNRGYLLIGAISFLIISIVFILSFTKYLKIFGSISNIGLILVLAHFLLGQKNPTQLSKIIFITLIILISFKMIKSNLKIKNPK